MIAQVGQSLRGKDSLIGTCTVIITDEPVPSTRHKIMHAWQ